MGTVPFYLQPQVTSTQKTLDEALQFDYDYDYQYLPEPQGTKSFWEELATPIQNTGAYAWDTVKGTWESVTDVGSAFAGKIYDVVDSAGTKITDKFFGTIDSVLLRLVIIFGVIIAGLWVLAKTGLIKDAAGILKTLV